MLTKHQILLFARIIEACEQSETITIYDGENDVSYIGVARHIVAPDSYGFPRYITSECRLRVTGTVDMFFPLGELEDWTSGDDGLWITWERG